MELLGIFVAFVVCYSICDWIIVKTDVHNKLLNKPGKKKHIKLILSIVFFIFVFLVEYIKIILKDMQGIGSYISTITGSFLGAVYVNFVPLIFKKTKK